MTLNTAAKAQASARLSSSWLGRLQKALTVFCVLALIAAGLTAAACAYAGVTADDNPLSFIVGDVPQLEQAMEDESVAREAAGRPAEVAYGNPEGVRLQIYTALGWLPSLLLVAGLLFVLRRTIRRARQSDTFSGDTADGLRLAGRLALIGGLVAWLAEWAARVTLNNASMNLRPGEEIWAYIPYTLRALIVDLPWLWVLLGVGLLAISAVFARAVAMREDLDGLV
ncbi:DUF2975 domain-containing protein [Phytomonospora endophytica]|uniref:DUF2975 domain-containing protein n=1 Tax=Phytomonospora endophytica TaxID=714109 RepID=A0A841FHD1_9ACTN|nr:DUF2975 domain-containing protein [Phytomonospora endophytica]MBB6035626.1 hypothetical protein [Phytomonospora endophytica]GIG70011.1 hypothetical protein Pen01_63060 [Phytomonospora endophytica]